MLCQSLAWQDGRRIRNGADCRDRRVGVGGIGVGAKAVHGSGRDKAEDNGQLEESHGLEVFELNNFGIGFWMTILI